MKTNNTGNIIDVVMLKKIMSDTDNNIVKDVISSESKVWYVMDNKQYSVSREQLIDVYVNMVISEEGR